MIVGPKDSHLIGYSHPKDSSGSVAVGQFVALVALRPLAEKPLATVAKIGEQLAQHVVGMKPTVMGTMPKETRLDAAAENDNEVGQLQYTFTFSKSRSCGE
uniref:Uncharacterized protein n=1 Tax=Plectus sambesii TaxID=2011161 RepID=A0A914VAI0_9BILA